MLEPEVVVEVQIQQRTVHVQKDTVNLVPVEHGVKFNLHCQGVH